MSSFIKLNSRQSVITPKNNLVDFDFEDGVYDLSRSFVNLEYDFGIPGENINSAITNDDADGIHPLELRVYGANTNNTLYNVSLVKNVEFKSSNKGTLEYIRDVNVLRQTLNDYTLTEDEKKSHSFKRISNNYDRSLIKQGLNAELHGEGSVLSTYNTTSSVMVPLSQLVEMGKMKFYDTDMMGRTRLHLELEISELIAFPIYNNDTIAGTQASIDSPNNNFNLFDTVVAPSDNFVVNQLVASNIPKDKSDSPYYVGQKLIITGSNLAQADTIIATRINKIEFINNENTSNPDVADLGKIRLSFESTIATIATAGENLNNIFCKYVQVQQRSVTVTSAELVLHKYNQKPANMPTVQQYRTFTTEQFDAQGSNNFKRIFEVEPEAMNLLVLQNNREVSSTTPDFKDYRISINNVPTTDRNVLFHGPLYKDKLVSTMTNMNLPLKNLFEENLILNNESIDKRDGDNVLTVIGEPLPMTNNLKLVQLEINTTSGVNKLNLYKQVVRSL